MIPDAATIARRRHLFRTLLRAGAVVVLVVGLFQTINALAFALRAFASAGRIASWTWLWPTFLPLAGYVSIAAALVVLESRLVRWLVPIARHRCPDCNYPLTGVMDARCPECGLPLPPELRTGV